MIRSSETYTCELLPLSELQFLRNFFCFSGLFLRFMKLTTPSRLWKPSWGRLKMLFNTCFEPKLLWNKTLQSRTTPSSSTVKSAWVCARHSPCLLEWPPINWTHGSLLNNHFKFICDIYKSSDHCYAIFCWILTNCKKLNS